jgi:hypothetical protein
MLLAFAIMRRWCQNDFLSKARNTDDLAQKIEKTNLHNPQKHAEIARIRLQNVKHEFDAKIVIDCYLTMNKPDPNEEIKNDRD